MNLKMGGDELEQKNLSTYSIVRLRELRNAFLLVADQRAVPSNFSVGFLPLDHLSDYLFRSNSRLLVTMSVL